MVSNHGTSLSVPPGLGPFDLLTAVMAPFHFHPPLSYAMLVGRSCLVLKRHIAVILWAAPIPRHGRGHGPRLPWFLTTEPYYDQYYKLI